MRTLVARTVAGRWMPSAVLALASFYLSVLLTLAAWAFVPALFGWTPMLISSGSMTPRINVGDVVVVDDHNGEQLTPGTVVTFRESDRLVTHRIVEVTDDGYHTQGDANEQRDSTPLADEAVVGTGRLLVPFIARPHHWLATGQHIHLAVFGLLTLAAIAGATTRPNRPDPASEPRRPTPVSIPRVDVPGPATEPVAITPTPPVSHLPPGEVWHARRQPHPQAADPKRSSQLRRRLLTDVPVVVLLVAALTMGVPAVATFSGATQAAGTWAGDLQPPTGVDATAGCSDATPHVEVTWTANPNADGYDLYRTTDPEAGWTLQAAIDNGATELWRDDTIIENTDYHYHLRATASSWQSDPSTTVTATPTTCT